MADKKISALTAKAAPVAGDTLVIVDSVGGDNKKITAGTLPVSNSTQTALNGKIAKDVGATYTTNAVKTLTSVEYAAIVTPDASTLYFIV